MDNVYIVDGARTAFGTFGGSFSSVDATEIGTATAVEVPALTVNQLCGSGTQEIAVVIEHA